MPEDAGFAGVMDNIRARARIKGNMSRVRISLSISILFTLLIMIALPTCRQSKDTSTPHQVTVFAAASLTEAFTELGRSFETANPGVGMVFNFAGS